MTKDQSYGGLILVVSIIIAFFYLYGIYAGFGLLLIEIPVILAVLAILGITGWIGWTMFTTPPPAPLETELASGSASTPTANTSSTIRASEPDEK